MVTMNAMKRRVQKPPPEQVGNFLKGLQQQGLSKKQIGNLAQKQGSPKAWQKSYSSIVARNNARGAAAAFGSQGPKKVRRGNPNYQDTTPRQGIVDTLSKNNPKSLPNRAANAAGDVGHAVAKGAKGIFGHRGPHGPVGAMGQFKKEEKQEAIKRRLNNKRSR